MSDPKDVKLYQGVNEADNWGQNKAQSKAKVVEAAKPVADEKLKSLHNALHTRLQTENPFDEFREAVEKAILDKAGRDSKIFSGDRDFYKETDDQGMCLSMHQPWASLLVLGFKRFEGREWTTKYRGPLYIHATIQKPDPDLIV